MALGRAVVFCIAVTTFFQTVSGLDAITVQNGSVTAKTGTYVALTCVLEGFQPNNESIQWSFNGDILSVQDPRYLQQIILKSDIYEATLTFLSPNMDLSGEYKCKLLEFSGVINVTILPGCFADIKSGPLSVGETQLIPCKNLHFALNKLGNANLTCIEDRRTRLSLTDCTFQRSHSNPLILFQYTVAKKTFNTNNSEAFGASFTMAFNDFMIERFQNIGGFRVANVYLAYLGQSSTFKVGLLAIFLEIETANQNINDLNSRLPELNADIKFSDSSTAIPTMAGKVVLLPQDVCSCPNVVTNFDEALVEGSLKEIPLCYAPSNVPSPCLCSMGSCQCFGVFTSNDTSQADGTIPPCILDTDGDGIPNIYDSCEECCSAELEGGIMWPDTIVNTVSFISCSILHSSFEVKSFAKRRCNFEGWGEFDTSECTFKDGSNASVVILQGKISSSLIQDIEAFRNMLKRDFSAYGPEDVNVTTFSVKIGPNFRAGIKFPLLVNASVLTVYNGPPQTIQNPVIYGHVPSDRCFCNTMASSAGKLLETCVGAPGPVCSFPESKSPECVDPFVAIQEIDMPSQSVTCGLDSDGDGILDSMDPCPDIHVNLDNEPPCEIKSDPDGCVSGIDVLWDIEWSQISRNTFDYKRCPGGLSVTTGVAMRECLENGTWGPSIVTGCRSRVFTVTEKEVGNAYTALQSSLAYKMNPTGERLELPIAQFAVVTEATSKLRTQSKAQNTFRQRGALLPRDLESASEVLNIISMYGDNTNLFSISDFDPDDLFVVLDTLLGGSNNEWQTLNDDPDSDGSPMAIQSLERLVASHARSLMLAFNESNEPYSMQYEGKNILITTEIIPLSSDTPKSPVGVGMPTSGVFEGSSDLPDINIPENFVRGRAGDGDAAVYVVTAVLSNFTHQLPVQFQNSSSAKSATVGSSLISSQVGRLSGRSPLLSGSNRIRIGFPIQKQYRGLNMKCVFWNFTFDGDDNVTDRTKRLGGWSTEDVDLDGDDGEMLSCASSHLTSFAILVDVSGLTTQISATEAILFEIVSYIGCALSLGGLIATILFLFTLKKDLIEKVINFVHLNLCIALSCGLLIFLAGIETATWNSGLCTFVATLLHYFFLAAFSWMLCEGVCLYNMLVRVFKANARKWIYIYLGLGWGIPIPIVIISVGIKWNYYYIPKSYDTQNSLYSEIRACWLPTTDGIIAAFVAPMLAIILINCIFAGLALRSVYKFKASQMSRNQEDMTTVAAGKTIMKAFVIILPLLGLTWVIGLLAVNPYTTVFAWIFLFLNAFQGLFIFFFHVIRNDKVWPKLKAILCCKKLELQKTSSQGITNSTKATFRKTWNASAYKAKERSSSPSDEEANYLSEGSISKLAGEEFTSTKL